MPNRIVFTATLGELSEVPNTPYAYWAPKGLRELFQKFPPLDRDVARRPEQPEIADVKIGLQTSDDLRFTRYWWEVPVHQIATSRSARVSQFQPHKRIVIQTNLRTCQN